jgi:hypothetical protein
MFCAKHLLNLFQLCETNTKQLFTFKIDSYLLGSISEKKSIDGIDYNVFFECETLHKKYGIKFEIVKNTPIIR